MGRIKGVVVGSLILGALVGCKPEVDTPAPSMGSLEISQITVVGDQFTSGHVNGGLSAEKQSVNLGTLISNQLQLVGNVRYNVPYLAAGEHSGATDVSGVIYPNCDNAPHKIEYSTVISTLSEVGVYQDGPFDDLSIPNLRIRDLDRFDLLTYNPFFNRLIEPQSGEMNYLKLLEEQEHDFFISCIGYYDIYWYAINGGANAQGNAIKIPTNDEFTYYYNQLVDALLSGTTETNGVLLTIPSVEYLPYFTKNGYAYQDENCATHPVYFFGDQEVRIAEEGDWILMSADAHLGQVISSDLTFGLSEETALPDMMVLDRKELDILQQSINHFNSAIRQIAAERNLLLVDLNAVYQNVELGYRLAGTKVTNDYLLGGFFAADGIYPSDRGRAIVANEILKAINGHYEAFIPLLDPFQYDAVELP